MKIIFMGTPDFAVPTLKKLYDSGYEVQAVFTQPDKPKGRGYKLTPPPVKVLAQAHDTTVYQPQSLKKDGEEYVKIINDLAPDCIVVAAYGKMLPKSVLDIPRLGCVNVHGSLLPKYRGAGPIQWAVLNDEAETGITTMLMGEGMDTGDTLEKLDKGEITPVKQDESLATYAPMLSKELCPIDFTKPVRKIHKQICGLSDWPCATTVLEGKRLKVYKSEIASTKPCGKPAGTVVDNSDFSVACSDGVIRFTQVQAEGSKRMDTADFLRGRHIENGTVLG